MRVVVEDWKDTRGTYRAYDSYTNRYLEEFYTKEKAEAYCDTINYERIMKLHHAYEKVK